MLLRLFESEFFDIRMAIQHLQRTHNEPGIQDYIAKRLTEFPSSDIHYFLPQLVHLLLSYQSPPLEEFLLSRCSSEVHIALGMLWLLQSAFKDLKTTPQSLAFPLCQRVYNRVQAVIFNSEAGDDTAVVSFAKNLPVKEHIFPAIIGIGMIIASVASPTATIASKDIILSQGRKGRSYSFKSPGDSFVSPSTSSNPLPIPISSPETLQPSIRRRADSLPKSAVSHQISTNSSAPTMRKSDSMKALAKISSSSPSFDGLPF
jgi:hypothetical protein